MKVLAFDVDSSIGLAGEANYLIVMSVSPIPEPSVSLTVLALGALALFRRPSRRS